MNDLLITPDMYADYDGETDIIDEFSYVDEEDFTCVYCGEFEEFCKCDDWSTMKHTKHFIN